MLKAIIATCLVLLVATTALAKERIYKHLGLLPTDRLNVVVVGGGKGIGRGFTEYFLNIGAHVLIASPSSAEAAALELSEKYPQGVVEAHQVDFSQAQAVEEYLHSPQLASFFKNTHVAIFSGGLGEPDDVFNKTSRSVEKMLAIKRDGARLFSEFFAAQMLARSESLPSTTSGGILLPVGSIAGLVQMPAPFKNYSLSNRFLHEQIKSIAYESGGQIDAYVVASGWANTEMGAKLAAPISKVLASMAADSPLEIADQTLETVLHPAAYPYRTSFSNTIIPANGFNGIPLTLVSLLSGTPLVRAAMNTSLVRVPLGICAKFLSK